MAQHFQQSADSVVAGRRSDQHRNDKSLLQVLLQIVENFIPRGRNIGKQFLHQMLVIIGELFQHLIAGFIFADFHLVIHVDQLRSGMLAIDVSALERQIDEAADNSVFPDRDLPQQEGLRRDLLKDRQRFAQRTIRLVDLVDEQRMRNSEIGQTFQVRLQHARLGRFRFANHDGRVDGGQCVQRFLQKLDRARAIQESECLIQVARCGAIRFHRHLACARFG